MNNKGRKKIKHTLLNISDSFGSENANYENEDIFKTQTKVMDTQDGQSKFISLYKGMKLNKKSDDSESEKECEQKRTKTIRLNSVDKNVAPSNVEQSPGIQVQANKDMNTSQNHLKPIINESNKMIDENLIKKSITKEQLFTQNFHLFNKRRRSSAGLSPSVSKRKETIAKDNEK